MTENITLPRKHIDYAAHALEHFNKDAPDPLMSEIIHHLRTALAAEQPKPEPVGWHYQNSAGYSIVHWRPSARLDADMQAAKDYPNTHKVTPLYTAPPEDETLRRDAERLKHPGYIIGSHWLETAYSRICAGEAEADVLRDCGWERVDEALRRDAERYRWLRGEHSRIDPCIKANAKYRLERDSSTWVNIYDLDAAIDAAMKEDKR